MPVDDFRKLKDTASFLQAVKKLSSKRRLWCIKY
jgi:hypothetical protein